MSLTGQFFRVTPATLASLSRNTEAAEQFVKRRLAPDVALSKLDLRVEHGGPGLERLRETPGLPSQSLSPAPATQHANLVWMMHE